MIDFRKSEFTKEVIRKFNDAYLLTKDKKNYVPDRDMKRWHKELRWDMKRAFKDSRKEIRRIKRAEFWAGLRLKMFGESRWANLNKTLADVLKKLDEVLAVRSDSVPPSVDPENGSSQLSALDEAAIDSITFEEVTK